MDELCKIWLPILPKDVFRILALKSLANGSVELWEQLNKDETFDAFVKGIDRTERIAARGRGFDYDPHKGIKSKGWNNYNEMTERELCASSEAFFGNSFRGIGTVYDYEVPLDEKKDSARGKIDLLSATDSTVYVLEVKKCESNELPLRAFFEVFTFWKSLRDEDGGFGTFLDRYCAQHDLTGRNVVPGVLLCESSAICRSLLEKKEDDANVVGLYRRFIRDYGMKVFVYKMGETFNAPIQVEDRTEEVPL